MNIWEMQLKQYVLGYVSLGKRNKSKNKQMKLHQIENLLHSKENHPQNKTKWKKIHSIKGIRNLLGTHTTQH